MAAGIDSAQGWCGGCAQDKGRELIVTRVVDAPRQLVFRIWTQPEHIARWWGPQGFTTIHCEMDVRVGGAYRFGMRSPQGTERWKRGVYREIVEPERIVFTFVWEDPGEDVPHNELLTTVTFDEEGSGTRLTLRQTPFASAALRDSHNAGWTSTFERFSEYLATTGDRSHAASGRITR